MFALAAAVVWFLTAPYIDVIDQGDGLYTGLALLALHFAADVPLPLKR